MMTDNLANLYSQYLTRINDINIKAKEAQEFVKFIRLRN